MKALIIGSGAVGLAVAAALHRSGVETHLTARGESLDLIRGGGIKRRGILGDADVPPEEIRAFESASASDGGYDFILNCAKTTGNRDIADSLAGRGDEMLAPGGIFLLFQNGFGNEEAFLDVFGRERIYHASFAIGFQRDAPNVSRVTVFSKQISLGSVFGAPQTPCLPLAGAVREGGIPCAAVDDILPVLWAKLLYNCALNPLSALLGVNYGGLYESESAMALMGRLIDEVFAVMRAAGYKTFWATAEEYKRAFFEKIAPPTLSHVSSTLQDMRRGVPTEIDSLSGAVVRMARRFGVAAPCNEMLADLIHCAEALYDYPKV